MARLKKLTITKKKLLIIACAALLILFVLFVLEKRHVIDLYNKDKQTSEDEDAKTTSTAPTAQEDFSEGGERPIARGDKDEGLVADTGGSVQSIPPENQWSVSADKAITVYLPSKDSVLVSGSTLSGSSTLPHVNFRLIDDVSGLIAQGTLSVVNGKFSGTFSFNTSGANGRLDIYNASVDGIESSNVEIPVRFK